MALAIRSSETILHASCFCSEYRHEPQSLPETAFEPASHAIAPQQRPQDQGSCQPAGLFRRIPFQAFFLYREWAGSLLVSQSFHKVCLNLYVIENSRARAIFQCLFEMLWNVRTLKDGPFSFHLSFHLPHNLNFGVLGPWQHQTPFQVGLGSQHDIEPSAGNDFMV
jgi:hypothetical protein